MPTATFGASIDINVGPEAVFAYVADMSKHGEWAANPLQIEAVSSDPCAVGSWYRSNAEFNGVHIHAKFQVTEYQPPSRFGFAGEDSTGKFEHLFTFQARNGGTRLERRVRFNLTVAQWLMFLALLYPVRIPAARKALRLLKDRLEQPARQK